MTGKVITIGALGDNYIYLFVYEQSKAVVIDPGDCDSVLSVLDRQGIKLEAILITHHHFDHTAGAAALKKKTGCKIVSPDSKRIASTDTQVTGGDILNFGNEKIRVISTPGHTSTSACYYAEPSETNKSGIVFTGDTLFTGGCGRMFEGDEQTMWQSLKTLAALPDDTLVCPGHDYTIENHRFALTVEPENETTRQSLQAARENLQSGKAVTRSTIGLEKKTNIFLRSNTHEIKLALGMADDPAEKVFGVLRRRKDSF